MVEQALPLVLTLGYAADGAEARLLDLMSDPAMMLVDIRLQARSRWYHQWTKSRLTQHWGERYLHIPELGNIHYKERGQPIALRDPERGVQQVAAVLATGCSVVLLCACVSYERCHRKLVAEHLVAAHLAVAVAEVEM